MNAYIDASVLLRVVFRHSSRLPSWGRIETAVSSELVRVESLRTVDRARITDRLSEEEVAIRRAAVLETLEGLQLVPIGPEVLARAAAPFPTLLRSLDAIHLSTALLVRREFEELTVATHDRELATAARAVGLAVEGP